MKRKSYGPEESHGLKKPRKMATATIQLDSQETKLKNLLLDVARYIDESKEIKEKIELRFAGGWVRDKLLGIQSHDIDTAINAMTGENFCLKMKEYLDDDRNMEKHLLQPEDVGHIHRIQKNPEKSKHLETVTTTLLGFDLDFVNLRKETYSEDSRNPQVEFGTAQEDALRRDATINAMFYNLNTNLIEDFVGGLQDLDSKLVKTPLQPFTTFMDDPLRVLRLVRFASRLGFTIDPPSEKAMSDPSVMKALQLKISRERVGIEVAKMLKDKNPRRALELTDKLGLYSAVFTDPTFQDGVQPSTENWHRVYDCLEELRCNETPGSIYQSLVRSEDARYYAWVIAAITPWVKVPESPAVPGAKPLPPLGTLAAREGIRAENKLCAFITGALKNYADITSLKDAIVDQKSYIRQRDTLGMRIRKWDSRGGNWRIQALFALLVEAMDRSTDIFGKWQAFIDHLEGMGLMDASSFKSIADGKTLCQRLGSKPGTWVKLALDVCMEWQLRNPDITDPAGAIEEDDNSLLPSKSLPTTYTLSQLYQHLVESEASSKGAELEHILILTSCLSQKERLSRAPDDEEHATRLSLWIAKTILPDESIVPHDEIPDDTTPSERAKSLHHTRYKATLGLQSLTYLQTLSSQSPGPSLLLTLLAFNDARDSWTTPTAHSQAHALLTYYSSHLHSSSFLVDHLLQETIRPLFSKSKPETITSTGRKAMPSSAPPRRWVMNNIENDQIPNQWPLIIPPILTLLDDISLSLKATGLEILNHFLPKFPLATLLQTGLFSVFEDAIFPTLSYLPTLTPESESLALIGPAYDALFVLYNVRFHAPNSSGEKKDGPKREDEKKERQKFLDKIFRRGIWLAYTHCPDTAAVVTLLTQKLDVLIKLMGISCVKHLKYLIPLLSAPLISPFTLLQPALLLSTLHTLQTLILNAWPRLSSSEHRIALIRAVTLCWSIILRDGEERIEDGRTEGEEIEDVKRELKRVARLLVEAVESNEDVDLKKELRVLVDVDERLSEVWGFDEHEDEEEGNKEK
ncbi:hypothetical protein B7494_g4709 [Chlorociboria aeruginascens]|nr:hypothetical protein B7494_g4709 [Chlorociboria aeruginascens]